MNDIANESIWQWTDNTITSDYVSSLTWDDEEPNNQAPGEDCVAIYGTNHAIPNTLNDFACNHSNNAKQFVCSKPNGDSVNWRPVFKLCTNMTVDSDLTSNSAFDIWSNDSYTSYNSYINDIDFILNTFDAASIDQDSCNYRSLVIRDWNEFYNSNEFDSVRISLYKDGLEVVYFLFEATGDINSWFTLENMFDTSYYLEMKSHTISTFDITGMMNHNRE